jgi:hypothetical protein
MAGGHTGLQPAAAQCDMAGAPRRSGLGTAWEPRALRRAQLGSLVLPRARSRAALPAKTPKQCWSNDMYALLGVAGSSPAVPTIFRTPWGSSGDQRRFAGSRAGGQGRASASAIGCWLASCEPGCAWGSPTPRSARLRVRSPLGTWPGRMASENLPRSQSPDAHYAPM